MSFIRVLIVDDHEIVREGLQILLSEEADFEVVGTAGDGLSAVRLAETKKPDVILMDLVIPGIDGIEATRQIMSRWPIHKRPYIIAMTAHALSGDAEKCIAAGMNSYLSKPVQPDKLVLALAASRTDAPQPMP